MKAHYDDIGKTYTSTRGTDPEIYRHIAAHFGGAQRILNVGAGTGSYEPQDREVLALEPCATMVAQRSTGGCSCGTGCGGGPALC